MWHKTAAGALTAGKNKHPGASCTVMAGLRLNGNQINRTSPRTAASYTSS